MRPRLIQNLLFAQHLRIQRAAVLFPVKGPVQAIFARYIGLQKDTYRRCGGLEKKMKITMLYWSYMGIIGKNMKTIRIIRIRVSGLANVQPPYAQPLILPNIQMILCQVHYLEGLEG